MKPYEHNLLLNSLNLCQHYHGDRVAIADENRALTFSELWDESISLSDHLSQHKQDVVANALSTGIKFTTAFLACQLNEGCNISLPSKPTATEASNYLAAIYFQKGLSESGSAWGELDYRFTTSFETKQSINAPQPDYLNGISWVQFTSGSTGIPKAILLRQSALNANLRLHHRWLHQWKGRSVFCPMPQFHAMGGSVMQEYLYAGASLTTTNKFIPGTDLVRMQTAKTELLVTPPSYLQMMLSLKAITPDKLPMLKAIEIGSASVHASLIDALAKSYPGLTIRIRYGQSEAAGALSTHTFSLKPNTQYIDGTIGQPSAGIMVESDPTTQELRFKSPTCAHLKLEDGEPTPLNSPQNGWLHTGDHGQRSGPDGTWRVTGRSSTFIKRNGYRINPEDLEAVFDANSAVARSTAVGLPDPMAGEKIVVMIQLANDKQPTSKTELLNNCRQTLSAHKWPQSILIANQLPLTASGKPDRTKSKTLALALQDTINQ